MSWYPKALIEKAARFSELALTHPDVAHASLLNSFAVELLCRACLANITPYLLASSRHRKDGAIYIKHGSGSPPSLDSNEVLSQCVALVPGFDKVSAICDTLAKTRNADLHSGENPWTKPQAQNLRMQSYVAIGACLAILSVSLDDFFGPHAETAREYIDGYRLKLSKHWNALLSEARRVYIDLSGEETARRVGLTLSLYPYEKPEVALRPCPACTQTGVMNFKLRMLAPSFNQDDGYVVQQGHRTPIAFRCHVCGLILNGSGILCEVNMGEVEPFASETAAIDFLTRAQAIEQIAERFDRTELLSDEQRELLKDGIQMRDYHDDQDYNYRNNK